MADIILPYISGETITVSDPPPQPDNLITKTNLLSYYLFGIPVSGFSTTCEAYPQEAYDRAIEAAYEWMETELTCTLIPKNYIDEQHPYSMQEYMHWAHLNLFHYPVLNLWRVRTVFPTSDPDKSSLIFPQEWYRISNISGLLNLVPSGGTIASFIIGQGGTFMPLALSGYYDQIPALFHVDYTAGFKHIPADINDLIAKKAAIDLLIGIGAILYPPGSASVSLGIDGVSQSVSLTRNKNLFQSIIDEWKENINQSIAQLRMKYTGIRYSVG